MVKSTLTLVVLVFLLISIGNVYGDTIYLKNGRRIEGLIKSENQDVVELQVCVGGIIKLERDEIVKIETSSPRGSAKIRQNWQMHKIETEKKIIEQRIEEERKPKKVQFARDAQSIIIGVRLNGKIEARLLLDTGASLVVLRKDIAKKLGIKIDKIKPDAKLILADGRQVNAKYIILKSLKVENVEAKNVPAAIMLDEVGNFGFNDGLLGMSFLKRFTFKVDYKNRRLVLEKI